MRTLAVTGAGGFLGRQLLAAALSRGWTVRALVRDPTTLTATEHLTVAPWEALQPESAVRHLAGVDVLCHLAAFIPADTSDASATERCFQVNVFGTLGLLAAATEAGVARLVHLSSGNAYVPAAGSVSEDHPLYPSHRASYYLASKLAGEVIVDHWARLGKISACVLRPASIYGPGMGGGLVKIFAEGLRTGRRIVVRDGGLYGADLVFVDDVVEAILAAAGTGATGPFNIGSGVRTTTRQLAGLLLELTGAEPDLVVVQPTTNMPDHGLAALNIARARAELDHRPTELRDGLIRFLDRLGTHGGQDRSDALHRTPAQPAGQ